MEFGLEHCLVRQEDLITGDKGRGEGAAEGIFHNLMVLGGAEQQANGGVLVGLADGSVQGLKVEFKLPEMLGFKAVDF